MHCLMFLPARPCPSPSCPPMPVCVCLSVCIPCPPIPGVRAARLRPTLLPCTPPHPPPKGARRPPLTPTPTPTPNQSHTGDKMDRVIYGKGEGAYTSGTKKKMHSARY